MICNWPSACPAIFSSTNRSLMHSGHKKQVAINYHAQGHKHTAQCQSRAWTHNIDCLVIMSPQDQIHTCSQKNHVQNVYSWKKCYFSWEWWTKIFLHYDKISHHFFLFISLLCDQNFPPVVKFPGNEIPRFYTFSRPENVPVQYHQPTVFYLWLYITQRLHFPNLQTTRPNIGFIF